MSKNRSACIGRIINNGIGKEASRIVTARILNGVDVVTGPVGVSHCNFIIRLHRRAQGQRQRFGCGIDGHGGNGIGDTAYLDRKSIGSCLVSRIQRFGISHY